MITMDFKDTLIQLSERILKLKDSVMTEEATKNGFIMPFINALGYDVFNPLEVIPEYTCDIGTKKGEKIDYAILKDGAPIILIECKHWRENLNVHSGQLLRYFHVSKAKFGILTNGIEYRFFTDLDETNKLDEKPFLNVSLTDLRDNDFEELKKFHKSYFDVERILNTASELKYMVQLKELISNEMENPSAEFVRLFAKQVYSGPLKEKILEQFAKLLKRSFVQLNNELVTGRLKTALKSEESEQAVSAEQEPCTTDIVTTDEEKEAHLIIKAILARKVEASRITMRDAKSYCAILLDDNNRKTLCRLYFGQKKYVAFLDEGKKEVKVEIQTLNDLFTLEDKFYATLDLNLK